MRNGGQRFVDYDKGPFQELLRRWIYRKIFVSMSLCITEQQNKNKKKQGSGREKSFDIRLRESLVQAR